MNERRKDIDIYYQLFFFIDATVFGRKNDKKEQVCG